MQKNKKDFTAIILAAGLGKRMQSELPKVLHKIGSRSMISRTISTISETNPVDIVTVASPTNIQLLRKELGKSTKFAIQRQQLGTADAVKSALTSIKNTKNVAVLYGDDTAFYKSKTILSVYEKHINSMAKITFVTLRRENPQGLGRIVRKNGKLESITEEKDATNSQKKIKEVNDGLYFFNLNWLKANITKLTPSKATGELYITDLIEVALREKVKVETYLLKDSNEWHGINNKFELELAQQKLVKTIHFMGIAGSGASAVAQIASAYGYKVTGCDLNIQSPYLGKFKIILSKGHDQSHIKNIDMLIVSPAILISDPKNNEILEARRLQVPVVTWQEFQGKYLQNNKITIAVAGAYGKSTTTAMISQILTDQNLDPTCEIGAKIEDWDKNFRVGKSQYYICEADEYNNNFLYYKPQIAIVLNLAWDHPDFFPTEKKLIESYISFVNNIQEKGVLITTEKVTKTFVGKIRKDIKVIKITNHPHVNLKLIGSFRCQNADAALTLAKNLNLNMEKAKITLVNFNGVGRRLELKGKIAETLFYDDYAVQPFTIEKTINALRKKYKHKKILLVLEPHTNSRIKAFFKEFVKALANSKVDQIYITDVFTARETADKKNNLSKKLASSIGSHTMFTGSVVQTSKIIKKELGRYNIICSMGAGNSYKIFDLVKKNE